MGTRLTRSKRARSGPEQRPRNDAAFRNTDDQQIRTDAVDNATDLGRGIAQKDAHIDWRRVYAAPREQLSCQAPLCIAHQLVLVLCDSVAVQMWRHTDEEPGTR